MCKNDSMKAMYALKTNGRISTYGHTKVLSFIPLQKFFDSLTQHSGVLLDLVLHGAWQL